MMKVNTYYIESDGAETLHCEGVTLLDCFPDGPLDPEYFAAQRELEAAGRYWGGGGASPLFLIMRA